MSLLSTFFVHEHSLIESAEQVEEKPPLLLVKGGNEFFPQVHLNATDLLELRLRLLSEGKQGGAPIRGVRQADQQPLPFERVN